MRCLIVDDSQTYLAAAAGMLAREGVDVVGTATHGAAAVGLAADLRPDVALVDVDLGGENGFDVAEQLAGPGPRQTPVIMISTHAEAELGDLIEGSAAIGFLSKFALSAAAVRDLLDGRALAGPGQSDSR